MNGYKILADLVPGPNKLVLKSDHGDGEETAFTIVFKPQTNTYFVRAIYLTDKTGDTAYQTPLPDDPQDYRGKLSTALLTMQSFTAERMNDLGFGRRTFNLELDENGCAVVHVFKCADPAETYYAMKDQAWFGNIAGQLTPHFPTKAAKNFVVAAYTRWDPVAKKAKAHTALGGGGQGLFGGGSLFAWPARLQDIQSAFMNATRVDKDKVQDDSAGRSTFWGVASTTIGACLHEVGHSFGLPHSREPMDIMTRGFDHFNRAFTFVDPPSAVNKDAREFSVEKIACFAPISASFLAANRWFALDAQPWNDTQATSVSFNNQKLICASPLGIRHISLCGNGGEAFKFLVPPAGADQKVEWDLAPFGSFMKDKKEGDVMVRVLDGQGNSVHVRLSPLLTAAAGAEPAAPALPLVPWPKELILSGGEMELTAKSAICVPLDPKLEPLARVLQREIRLVTGLSLNIAKDRFSPGDIDLELRNPSEATAYTLTVDGAAMVEAGNDVALSEGTVTLLQALRVRDGKVFLPRMTVKDSPDFPYRALMIDLGRKFHSIDGIKQVVELCRLYKLRYLHLHLSDDQLFMFPSTAFPSLGKGNREFARFDPASTTAHIPPYTLAELKDLEDFARARSIAIIPEIDMPGHSSRLSRNAE